MEGVSCIDTVLELTSSRNGSALGDLTSVSSPLEGPGSGGVT